jgi:hypothetical protein
MPRCWSNSRTMQEAAAGRGCGLGIHQNSDGSATEWRVAEWSRELAVEWLYG